MPKNIWLRVLVLTVVLGLALAACRRQEEEPTPLPTAVPTAIIPTPANAQPTPTPAPPAAGGQAAVDPADIDWPPQVIYSSPAPGEEALLDGAITIRFDQPMNQPSVEKAFAIEAVDDEGQPSGPKVNGRFSWPRPDTLIFTPDESYQRRQRYRVNIGQAATSLNGFTLDTPLQLYLQTIGSLQVSQVIPAAGAERVDTNSAVTALFNRPVVPLVTTGQQADLPQPLSFDPPVTGQGEWVSTSIYRFMPDEPLAAAATYQVSIADDLTDFTGAALSGGFNWQFTTVRPAVVTFQPALGDVGVNPSAPITITFNTPMDRASTEAAVALGTTQGKAAVDAAWFDDDRVLQITPRQPLNLETEYQIVVNDSAQSASGGAALDRQTVSSFQTVVFPGVALVHPTGLAEAWQYGISVEFASPMDWDTVDGRIRINPPPDDVDYFFSKDGSYLSLNFELELNTAYQVTIPGDAADPYGNTLGRDYTWRFTTPPSPPIASFNLPGRISQVSASFATDVELLYRNVNSFNVSLFDLGLPLNLLGEPYQLNDYRPAATPIRRWEFAPDAPDDQAFLQNVPLADGGVLPAGVYMLTVDSADVGDARYWQNQRHLLIVADANIVVKEMFGAAYVWVTDIASGQPVSGRNLALYNQQGARLGTAVSDKNGFAQFDYTPPNNYLSGVLAVSNQPGQAGFGVGSSNWNEGVSPWQFDLDVGYEDEPELFAYIYTDRPIYRPGDTIYFKGLVRQTDDGRYQLPDPQTLTLRLNTNFYDPEGAGLDDTLTVSVSPDGVFTGEYQIPEDAAAGSYQLFLDDRDFNARRAFSVAEYRKPEFLLTLTPDRAEALRGETVAVTVDASYFFGGPAADLEVQWNIYADAYQPPITGSFYFFGDGGDYFYHDFGPFGFGGGGFLGDWLANGNGRTDGDGRLIINLPADLLKDRDPGSQTLTVEVTVNDISEFPVVGRASVTLHAAEIYVGVVPANYIARAGTETSVNLITQDWEGNAAPNQTVEVVFYQREWERTRDAEFGIYRTIWQPVDTEIDRVRVTTNNLGKATASFVPPEGGSYVAVAAVTDSGGRQHVSSANLWAADERFIGWRTDPRERRMELVPDKQAYQPGETARILVQSPFAGPIKAWLTIERGQLIEQRVITLQSNSDVIDVPLPLDYAPNVFVSVTAVKPVTPDDPDNPYADIRLGIAELAVSPEQLGLNVTLTPAADLFAPGETAVYDIFTTDKAGNPVSADVSLALVDLAVLTLKKDNAPDILEAFYAPQPYRSQVGGGLFISGEGMEPEIPVETAGLGGGGGDGLLEDTAISRAAGTEEDDEKVRQDFPDTAFWRASLQTDADGRAAIEIPLPDSLTTWRLSSKAITADSKVGQTSVDVVVTLPLLLRPVTPRFFTVGDVVQIGTIVNNNTGSEIEAAVTLEAEGLGLRDDAEQTVTIPANGRVLARWQVEVKNANVADLTFRVAGGGYRDAAKPTFGDNGLIPIYRYDAPDIAGTAGILDGDVERRVEAVLLPELVDMEQGSIDVTLSPSLAAALLQSLDYLERPDYQFVCAYSVTDRLLANAATARAISALNLDEPKLAGALADVIPQLIRDLEGLVKTDGGWGWCYSNESDEWLTAYTLLALSKAQETGYPVSGRMVNDAARFLADKLAPAASLSGRHQVNRQAFFLYVLAEARQTGSLTEPTTRRETLLSEMEMLFDEHRHLLDPYAKAYLALAYEVAGNSGGSAQMALLADLNDTAVLSATGTHWEDVNRDYRNLSSVVRGTAVILDALARIDPANPLGAGAVRWLMSARTASHWATEHETAWVINALADWMAATGELEADYEYRLALNSNSIVSGQFDRETILDSRHTSIPLRNLVADEVNFLDFQRAGGNGRLYYTAHLNSFLPAASVTAVNRGFSIERAYYDAACDPETDECQPITQIAAGGQVRVELTIVLPNDRLYVLVEDPIPAGAEAIDPGLETTAGNLSGDVSQDNYRRGYWGWWQFNRIEYRDAKVVFRSNFLPAGTYQYTYFLQTNIPGEFQVMPATARETFFPEIFGRSDGKLFMIME